MVGFSDLNEALAGKKDAVLRFGPGDDDRLLVRFDGDKAEPGKAFRIVCLAGDPPSLDRLIEGRLPVELAFNTPGARVYFDAIPIKRGRKWFTHWAMLNWPERLNVVERRTGSREQLPDDVKIVVVLSLPDGGPTLRAQLWDVDLTGAACICPVHPDLPVPQVDQACGVLLTYRGEEYRLNGFCKNVQRLSTNSLRVGLQLLSETETDPSTLVRFKHLLGELQALRIRRGFRRELRNTVMFGNN